MVQYVVSRISTVECDPRLLRESRQTEIDFAYQLEVHGKRPRQWALNNPVIPTRWVDERCSRLCEKEFGWSSSNVKCATSDVTSRKIMVLDESAMCRMASAVSEVAAELQHDEQACQESMLGEWSYSLSLMRKAVCNWEKKLQKVLIDDHVPISKLSSRARLAWIHTRSFHCRR